MVGNHGRTHGGGLIPWQGRFLRAMLREEIEANLPAGAVEATRAAEESERAMIGWAADNLAS